MAENPIKASDLIADDLIGALKAVADHLREILKGLAAVGVSIKDEAGAAATETKKINAVQKESRPILEANAQQAEKLARANEALKRAKTEVETISKKVNVSYKEATAIQANLTALAKEEAKFQHAVASSKTEVAKTTQILKAATRELNKETQISAKLAVAAEGSFDQLSARYAQMKATLNAMSSAQRYNTAEGQAMEKQSKAIYNEMIRLQSATGRNQLLVGGYANALKDANMSLRQMQLELRKLKTMDLSVMSPDEVRDVEKAIGELTDRMRDYRAGVEALGMDTFQMISGAVGGAVAAVQGLAGAFNVLGIQNETLAKVQQNMMSMIAITQALERIEKLYQEQLYQTLWLRVKEFAQNVKNAAIKKYDAAATWLQVRAQQAQVKTTVATTAATKGATVATKLAAVATTGWAFAVKAFNKAIYNIPVFGWLLAIIGAIIAAVVVLVRHWDKVTDAFTRFGQTLGIVNKQSEEMKQAIEAATARTKLMNAQLEIQKKRHDELIGRKSRNIELMKIEGKSTEEIIAAEKDLLQTQIFGAKKQVDLLRQSIQRKALWNIINDEEKKSLDELLAKIDEWEIGILRLDATSRNMARERAAQRAEEQRAIEAAQAEYLKSEERAKLEFAILTASSHAARTEAKVALIKHEGELEREAMQKNSEQYKLSLERQKQSEAEIRREALSEWIAQEEEVTRMLADINNTAEQKELSQLYERYQQRLNLAKDAGEGEAEVVAWWEREKARIRKEYRTKEFNEALAQFDQQQTFAENAFLAVKRTEAEKTRYRLEAEKERFEFVLSESSKHAGMLTEQEVENYKNMIQAINNEIDGLGREQKDIYEILGIKLDDKEKQAIAMSTQYAISMVQNLMQARVQAAQAAVNAAKTETDAARKKLEDEKKLAADGFASRVDAAQKEFDAAEARQKQAEKLEQRRVREQQRLQSLEQAGNLLVASTKIWNQLGFPLAIPAIAFMWGNFILSRRKARQLTAERYGSGHFEMIKGGSHASGNDVPLNIDSRNRRVEGGEAFAVFNRKATKHYGSMLPALVDKVNTLNLEKATGDLMQLSVVNNGQTINTAKMEQGINKLVEQGANYTYIDSQGRLVVVKNQIKKIYV